MKSQVISPRLLKQYCLQVLTLSNNFWWMNQANYVWSVKVPNFLRVGMENIILCFANLLFDVRKTLAHCGTQNNCYIKQSWFGARTIISVKASTVKLYAGKWDKPSSTSWAEGPVLSAVWLYERHQFLDEKLRKVKVLQKFIAASF